jgi:hypothetical protein
VQHKRVVGGKEEGVMISKLTIVNRTCKKKGRKYKNMLAQEKKTNFANRMIQNKMRKTEAHLHPTPSKKLSFPPLL